MTRLLSLKNDTVLCKTENNDLVRFGKFLYMIVWVDDVSWYLGIFGRICLGVSIRYQPCNKSYGHLDLHVSAPLVIRE